MNKSFLTTALSAVLLFAGGQQADAASWRINNNANRHAHFTDINAAMSSNDVVAGDTLYLDPGCLITSTQNVTKRVTIIGTGYFLDGTIMSASINAGVYLKAVGIKFEGVAIAHGKRLSIEANDVIVERCSIWDVFWSGTGQNTTFRQCYVTGRIVGNGISNISSSGCTIENCIIYYDWDGNYCAISDLYNATLRNNYVRSVTANSNNLIGNLGNSIVINNIFIQQRNKNNIRGTLTDCNYNNNVMSCDEGNYSTFPDNLSLGTNDESTVFALEGTNDQRYQLKDDSPAKGYATDGGDCGPFGGRYPYVPSGYPLGMPRFESSAVGTRPQSGQVSVTQEVTIQKQ